MAIAGTLAYIISIATVDPSGRDITAPMTTVLIMQASFTGTFASGLRRTGAVFSGVIIGVALALVIPLRWWSLAVVIPAAMLVGYLLDLREHLGETAVTALLVFATTNPATTGEVRFILSLIGIVIGVGFVYLLPQRAPRGTAAERVKEVADRTADTLASTAAEITADRPAEYPSIRPILVDTLSRLQEIEVTVSLADQAILQEKEARRLTPVSVTADDSFPLLHDGLEAIRSANRHIAGHLSGVLDEDNPTEHATDHPTDDTPDDTSDRLSLEPLPAEHRALIADAFDSLSGSIRALGELLATAGQGHPIDPDTWSELEARLAEANDRLRANRNQYREFAANSRGASPDFISSTGSLALALTSSIRALDETRWHGLYQQGRAKLRLVKPGKKQPSKKSRRSN